MSKETMEAGERSRLDLLEALERTKLAHAAGERGCVALLVSLKAEKVGQSHQRDVFAIEGGASFGSTEATKEQRDVLIAALLEHLEEVTARLRKLGTAGAIEVDVKAKN